jgi:hypothetical protein
VAISPHILGHMPVTVKVQDQSGAGRVRATTTLEGISSKITLRDDDRQVTELDEPLDLTADSDIRFVRLVQLVGG